MERETHLEVYRIDLICDQCGFPMKAGPHYGEQPLTYVHDCTNPSCINVTHITGKEYPYMDYRDVIE